MRENIPAKLVAFSLTAPDSELAAVLALIDKLEAARASGGVVLAPSARFLFQRSGQIWRVVFEGEEFHLEDTLGARYLNHLLHHPNEPISAFDLEVAITPEKGHARDRQTIQLGLDGETVREYLRELERLRAEGDEAREAGDSGQIERIEADIIAIEEALKGGSKSVDTGERARVNVCKRVRDVSKRLQRGGRAERALAAHLDAHLSLGYECLYTQAEGGRWE